MDETPIRKLTIKEQALKDYNYWKAELELAKKRVDECSNKVIENAELIMR